jgi:hypothetical protein
MDAFSDRRFFRVGDVVRFVRRELEGNRSLKGLWLVKRVSDRGDMVYLNHIDEFGFEIEDGLGAFVFMVEHAD